MDACNQIHSIILHWKESRSITQKDLGILDQHVRNCDFCADDYGLLRIIIENQSKKSTTPKQQNDHNNHLSPTKQKVTNINAKPQTSWLPNLFGILYLLAALTVFFGIAYPEIVSLQRVHTFSLEYPEARQVSLVGDFNGWDLNSLPMEKSQGTWKIKLRIKPGTYAYNFVIDGDQWITDPVSMTVDDGFGGKNSLLEVK